MKHDPSQLILNKITKPIQYGNESPFRNIIRISRYSQVKNEVGSLQYTIFKN